MRHKTLKVMGNTVKIIHIKNYLAEANRYGSCYSDDNIIKIDADLNDKDYDYTLKHELLHYVLYKSGISFLLKDGIEEAIVRCIEYNFLNIKI